MEKCSKIVAQYRIANITKKRVNVFRSTLTHIYRQACQYCHCQPVFAKLKKAPLFITTMTYAIKREHTQT